MKNSKATRITGIFDLFEKWVYPYGLDYSYPWSQTPTAINVLWHYATSFKRVFIVLGAVCGCSAVAEVYLMSLVGGLVDRLQFGGVLSYQTLNLALIILMVALGRFVFGALEDLIIHHTISTSVTHAIRWDSLLNLLRRDISHFQSAASGKIAMQTVMVSLAIRNILVEAIRSIWFLSIFIIVTFAMYFTINQWLVVVVAIWFLTSCAIFYTFVPKIRRGAIEAAEVKSELTGRMADIFSNITMIRIYSNAEREQELALEIFSQSVSVARRQMRSLSLMTITLLGTNLLMISTCILISLYFWQHNKMMVGEIATVTVLSTRLYSLSTTLLLKINALSENWGTLQNSLQNFESVKGDSTARVAAMKFPQARGQIELRNIRLSILNGPQVLRGVSLAIPPGARVGIVGPSGAGKTTLLQVLMGLYNNFEGQVLIDGYDVSMFDPSSVRQQFSVVSQDYSVLNRSLRENLQLGVGNVPDSELLDALKSVHALSLVEKLRDPQGNEGLDASLGERGTRLSGGERQRIAIARALLKNAPIVILDEPTSALDSITEANIEREIHSLLRGKTIITVSHRLSTLVGYDSIGVLDHGQLVQLGSHHDLLGREGVYRSMWKRQMGLGPVAGFLDTESS